MYPASASSIFISPPSVNLQRRPALPSIKSFPSKNSSKSFPFHHSPPKTLRCFSRKQATEEFERLFSNLNQATMKREPGSITSAIFLVAGTTVGAGILAIPAVTQEAGFLASAITCILCWIYMVVTGLLIAEVNLNTMCELGSGGVSLMNFISVAIWTLSCEVNMRNYEWRKNGDWSYLFIHYALLVAYIARSSDILTNSFGIPLWESATLFSLIFGGICYYGSQRVLGAINGVLVFGIVISFTALVGVASGDLQWSSLLQANFEAVPQSNVVPVLCTNLEGNLSKVRTAIVFGTAVPLALFLIWDAVLLGTLPNFEMNAENITDPLEQLRSNNGIVGPIVEVFSFLAIGTSYIGFVLGLTDFIADLLKLPAGQNKLLPYLLTLVPPFILALLDPEIFFKALDLAGTYGVLVLFGVLPGAMSWSERYSSSSSTSLVPPLVPGGKVTLTIVMGVAFIIIFSELIENFVRL
ncbi:uncharacterized protein LOC110024399 isoform X3 [Phalaenopsis equestris]|uniref:uncharacterized protein LOC110024399 isoform X3 n=1 Tax=Phalaenopsis equestris TaxID=78828 RepID=UPI0009E4CFA1|nr:uncharacterized protein LOC110024399 isoform X3 [Phalaenopsis equestris]